MNRIHLFISILAIACHILVSCSGPVASTKVVAHRGYWDIEGSAQNSIASLRKAVEAGVYGSEFDVRITSDGVLVINHDGAIGVHEIEITPYDSLKNMLLSNGETLPTLQQYLAEGKKNPAIRMICEIKECKKEENNLRIANAVAEMVASMGMKKQVDYISFNMTICKELLRLVPKAEVAYLSSNVPPSPQELKELGFTGLDYHYNVLAEKPEWIKEAKQLGLTINVWTVNDPGMMKTFIEQGVDFITTDKPVELAQVIGSVKEMSSINQAN
ncbi:glycerophosphoryl diester phosphodiesterase [Bacteroidia bacterium]|nr:glycerophosphoryl diester phosphodiesterase [Bacteroidia bacterium]